METRAYPIPVSRGLADDIADIVRRLSPLTQVGLSSRTGRRRYRGAGDS